MPSEKDINTQRRLLAVHRYTLAHLLEQQAIHGTANVPPATVNGIDEARAHIQRIKRILQAWGVQVENLPDDGDPPEDQPAWVDIGRLRVTALCFNTAWQLVIENQSDQEILSVALTLRPPRSLFVGQEQFSIPRIVARGRAETKPFTIVDPKAASPPRSMNALEPASRARRTRLEQQRDRLDTNIAQMDADIDRLERQRRLAAGREQLQREDEIQQLQAARRRYEEELQTIEAQLERLAAHEEVPHAIIRESSASSAPVQLRLLASYTVAGQGIQQEEGDLPVSLV